MKRAIDTLRLMNVREINRRYSRPFNAPGTFSASRTDIARVVATHARLLEACDELLAPDADRRERAREDLQRLADHTRHFLDAFSQDPATSRRMPALMRGSERGDLCLTRRQRDILHKAAQLPEPSP